jgi:hypothetical protein
MQVRAASAAPVTVCMQAVQSVSSGHCCNTECCASQVLEREQVQALQHGKELPDFRSGDILEVTTVSTASNDLLATHASGWHDSTALFKWQQQKHTGHDAAGAAPCTRFIISKPRVQQALTLEKQPFNVQLLVACVLLSCCLSLQLGACS